MSHDLNACCFSGKVEKFKRIDTETGTPMITFKLKCWKEQIKIVGFKQLAEETNLIDGARVQVAGRLQSSSWEYEGAKYHSFQIVAEKIKADTEEVPETKKQPTRPVRTKRTRAPRQQPDTEYREPIRQDSDSMPF